MAWARTSNVSATNTSITLVVFLDQGLDVLNYSSIYITLNGQMSGNLRGRHWNGQKHWSLEWTFYGLSPGTTYYASCSVNGSMGDGGYYRTQGTAGPPPLTQPTSARVSNLTSPTDTSITVVVQANQGSTVANSYITVSCNGQTSGDLGYIYSSNLPHWSQPYTFNNLSPGTNYTVTGYVSGVSFVTSYSFTTTGIAAPTTPLMNQHSTSGKFITMQVLDYYQATSLEFYLSWTNTWYSRTLVNPANYTFEAPEYGGNYEIWVRGVRNGVYSQVKKAAVYSQPRTPSLKEIRNVNNTVTLQVSNQGYWTSIRVEMWTDGAGSMYAYKDITWNGNTNYSGELTFGAMVPFAKYQFRAIAYKEYNSGYGGWLYVTNVVPPTTPLMFHHSSSGTAITMEITNYYEAQYLDFRPSWTSTVYREPIGRINYIFNAPAYGTEYTMAVRGVNAYGESQDKLANVMTEPSIPSISGTVANNVASIKINAGSGQFTNLQVEWWNEQATIHYETKTATVSGATITFAGLESGKTYLFKARSYKVASYPGGYAPFSPYGGWLTLKNSVARPVNWTWVTATNGSGQKIQGATFQMTATEWNDFLARVNQFLMYKELPQRSYTSATKGNTFFFYMFNEANQGIGAMKGTGVGNVTTGSDILASQFNSLMNTLNSL
jgi:hypothetical protein